MAILVNGTAYGVTPEGFNRMRLPEIQSNLFDRLEAKLGYTVSRKANSMIGVLIGIIAEESDRQWQLAEYDYYARSPVTADEGSFDNTLMYTNIIRRDAESTYLYEVCYGSAGTVLPNNCQVKGNEGEKYNIAAVSSISLDNCVHVTLAVASVAIGTQYDVILNNDIHLSYIAISGDNASSVYSKLLSQLGSSNEWSGSVIDGNLVLEQTDRRYGGSCVPSETFDVVQVGSPIRFNAENYGPLDPPINTIKQINTNYDGWTGCNNESAAYVGRNAETITEARQRYASAVYKNSVSMKESIRAALLELPDVQSVTVYENRSDEVVDDMKPHSFEVIIHGGDDREIAQTILEKAPIGIDSNGDIAVEVTDSEGTAETIYFNRPEEIPIYVRITIEEYTEESLPGDLVNTIKRIVAENGNSLEMGKDVIAQRFLGPIYSAVDGISYINLTISTNASSGFTGETIAIARGQIATFAEDNISVAIDN